jgi:hypothetical protein
MIASLPTWPIWCRMCDSTVSPRLTRTLGDRCEVRFHELPRLLGADPSLTVARRNLARFAVWSRLTVLPGGRRFLVCHRDPSVAVNKRRRGSVPETAWSPDSDRLPSGPS